MSNEHKESDCNNRRCNSRKTTEQFIEDAKKVHGDLYNYSKVDYNNSHAKVIITCLEHGPFRQSPNDHLKGSGCPACKNDRLRSTIEQFIENARKVHGDKYNYDKVDYNNSRAKVIITCLEHGPFRQSPSKHLRPQGCPTCKNDKRRLNTDMFVEKAKAIHGDKYNYDQVEYKSSVEPVKINCLKHGPFFQVPSSHLRSQGCPACKNDKLRLNTDMFVEKARAIHGDKYNYDKVEYKTNKEPVIITCLEHRDFRQSPGNHLRGQNCPNCCGNLKLTTNQFVEKARKVHGDRYDYSKVNYINSHAKVVITCLRHGPFHQSANSHLQGAGCDICKNDRYRSTTDMFVENAKKVHGDRYEYSKVHYNNSHAKVVITCLQHGDFRQSPASHLNGAGCPACKSSRGESAIRKILLKHDIEFTQQYSIPNQKYKFKYDFYLPKLNLIIEYHGIQHYVPIKYFGGEEGLNATRLRDSLKKDIAKGCGYKFLEIKYTHFSNLTEEEFEKRVLYVLTKTRSLVLTK